jgi:Kef-type K+ transport system membrane component KefB
MTPGLILLVQALVIVALPAAVLRFSRLKGRVPLIVVQIAAGLALRPSLFGRLAPEYHLPSGIGSVAVLVFGLITGLHLDPKTFRGNGGATSAVAFANIVGRQRSAVPAGFGSSLAILKS